MLRAFVFSVASPSTRLLLLPILALAILAGAGTAPDILAQRAADQLATARRLEANGEWDQAPAYYRNAMADGGETAQVATLELARLYERADRFTEALPLLEALVARADPGLSTPSRAWFQYGSVLQSLGRPDESIAAYRRAVALGSPAAAYARVETAKQLIARDDHAGALTELAPLLGGQGPENAQRVALRLAAGAAERLGPGRAREALGHYRAHAALATSANERVPSLYRAGALARAQGETAVAVEAFREIVVGYPGSGEAVDALDGLAALGRPAGALEAALVHYRRRNNETARRLYNGVRETGSAAERAAALFYLGALAERRGEPALALENYGESLDAAPDGRFVDEALWARAGVREDLDDLAGAQADYARIVERGTDFARVAEAAFRNGYIAYEAGQLADARRRWSAAGSDARAGVAATTSFWAGRAAADQGDSTAAQAAWTEAARRDPRGYYGLRAAALLAGRPGAPSSGPEQVRVPTEDWAAAERWLTAWAGPEDAAAWARVQASDDWRATWELAEVGWYEVALDAFVMLLDRRQDQPWLQYRAGRALAEGGFPRAAFTAGYVLWARSPDAPVPAAVERLRFPAPWSDLVQRQADARGLDPLLVYAMMRQESAFDPHAGSSAGAFGLTQFIEGTANDVARALGRSGFRFRDLARPSLAIEFGAFYLGAQVRQQGDDVYRALAAYNGGGGNADRWRRNAGGMMDVDRFQEEIDFGETEAYIRLVIENYARYRHLYGVTDRPSIVR